MAERRSPLPLPTDAGPRWSLVPDARPAARNGDGPAVEPEPPIVDVAAAAVVLVPPPFEGAGDDPLAAALGLPPAPPRAAVAVARPIRQPGARGGLEPAPGSRVARPRPQPDGPDLELAGLRAAVTGRPLERVEPPPPPSPPRSTPAADARHPTVDGRESDVEQLAAEVAALRQQVAELAERREGSRHENLELVALIALVAVLVGILILRGVKG